MCVPAGIASDDLRSGEQMEIRCVLSDVSHADEIFWKCQHRMISDEQFTRVCHVGYTTDVDTN